MEGEKESSEQIDIRVVSRVISIPTERYSLAWFIWLLVTLGGFAALESYAVWLDQHHNTLSFHTRRVFGIEPRRHWTPLGKAGFVGALAAFFVWFANHIAFSDDSGRK